MKTVESSFELNDATPDHRYPRGHDGRSGRCRGPAPRTRCLVVGARAATDRECRFPGVPRHTTRGQTHPGSLQGRHYRSPWRSATQPRIGGTTRPHGDCAVGDGRLLHSCTRQSELVAGLKSCRRHRRTTWSPRSTSSAPHDDGDHPTDDTGATSRDGADDPADDLKYPARGGGDHDGDNLGGPSDGDGGV